MKTKIKKYQAGGVKPKTTVEMEKNKYTTFPGRRKSIETNNKGNVINAVNRDTKQTYRAYNSGVVAVENIKGEPKYSAAMDTTGYSAGKKMFPTTIKKNIKTADGREGTKAVRYSTSRKNVMPTLKKMETSVTNPKKKTTPKKKPTGGKKLM